MNDVAANPGSADAAVELPPPPAARRGDRAGCLAAARPAWP